MTTTTNMTSVATTAEVSNIMSPEQSIITGVPETVKPESDHNFEPSNLNVWEEIGKQSRQTKQFMSNFSSIFVLGNQSAGKTTLINNFLEKSDSPKPTLALDYSFARLRSADKKHVCHIWELGGDAKRFSDLIETPIITTECLDKLALFLVIDLSEPEKIWPALDATITQGRKAFKSAVASMGKLGAVNLAQILDEKLSIRIADASQDKEYLDPFPLPLVIIGTKYDLFEKFEPEKRKTMCRLLRLVSHRLGASLNFFSKDDISLNRRARELFSHYAFDTTFPNAICQDMNKPLMIPHGADSYEQISPGVSPHQFTMEYCRHLYESKIGKSVEKENIKNDPGLDPSFREPDIDRKHSEAVQELASGIRLQEQHSDLSNSIETKTLVEA